MTDREAIQDLITALLDGLEECDQSELAGDLRDRLDRAADGEAFWSTLRGTVIYIEKDVPITEGLLATCEQILRTYRLHRGVPAELRAGEAPSLSGPSTRDG